MEDRIPKRLVIQLADIQVIVGCNRDTARQWTKTIRQQQNIAELRPLTVYHLSSFLDIPITELTRILNL